MPGGDRTGPMGAGPRTGRAAGYCTGNSVPGFMNPVGGRGYWGPQAYPGWSPYFSGAYSPQFSAPYSPYYAPPVGWWGGWRAGRGRGRGFGRGRGRRWW